MQRIFSTWIALALTFGSYMARAAGDQKAADLLVQARAALGGERQISKVKGLSGSGAVQRVLGDRQISGELTLDLQLPDKMLRTENMSPMGDAVVVTELGINGDKLLRHSRVLNAPAGAVIRMPPPPAAGSDAEAQQVRNSRAELARIAVAFLLTAPEALPIEFTYGGEAESPDGKADVLDLKGPANFAARLILDKASHRPLMLSYRGVSPRMIVQTQRGPAPRAPQPSPDAHGAGDPALPTPEVVDINMYFDDYKPVEGVMLPHHVSREVGGETTEEWTFKTFKVNPAFKGDTFEPKK